MASRLASRLALSLAPWPACSIRCGFLEGSSYRGLRVGDHPLNTAHWQLAPESVDVPVGRAPYVMSAACSRDLAHVDGFGPLTGRTTEEQRWDAQRSSG